jgi:signal transduction histidine kinase
LERNQLRTLSLDKRSPMLMAVWRTKECVAVAADEDLGWELHQLTDAMQAGAVLMAPLATSRRRYGVFVVFVNRPSLFADDDLAVLGMLAEQAALAIEGRQLVEEIERERSTLAAVMSSMHEGLIVMDGEGIIRYANARAAQLLELDERALRGSRAGSVMRQLRARVDGADALEGHWQQALRGSDSHRSLELRLLAPPRSLQADVFTVEEESTDGPRGAGVVLRDVTAERDLIRTKDELVSVVSHELRTPLASVVGFAELLRTRELQGAQRQQFLTVILEEGRRLTALINDFLDLQRMESGRQEIVPRPVRLRDFLEDCVATLGDDPAHPITLDVPPDLPAVRADPDRTQQVMTNLISNARKYSPAGGPIEISAREAEGQVIVAVQDHGLGLPPDALPRLFEKFYRVDNSDRRSITGTGLGLAISRKIVDAHGGRMWAESDGLGEGSRFSFSLPLADARRRSGEILIVEDDAGFARLLEAELAGRGLSSVWVPSAEDAFDQLEIETPRAIVLDLLLPRVQGEAFLERLRREYTADLPVVVVSVKDLTQDERSALDRLGVIATLRKEPAVGTTASDIIQTAVRRDIGVPATGGIAA